MMKVWLAVLTSICLLTLLAPTGFCGEFRNDVQHVGAIEAQQILGANSEIQVLDVRTPQEFSEGHIDGAININYYADDFQQQLSELDPNKTYLVHCRSGGRSGKSLAPLKEAGIERLIHLDGGIKAWKREGYKLNALEPSD